MDGGLLSLRWNDHSQTFFTMLSSIRKKESYCDVTLVCDGRFYPVHKLVLSTCSDFFDQVFSTTACKHPVIVVANVANKDLEALLNYMYLGEVNVLQTELTGLMKAAEVLRIKGLAEPTKSSSSKESRDGKRSSSWDTESPDSKRRKPEEVPVIQSKLSSTMGNLAASGSEADGTNLSKEQSWSRTSANDSSSKDKTHIPPGSGVSSNNSGDSAGNQQSSQQEGEQAQGSSEQPQSERALNPEVKLEEVLVKDEPSGWYPEGDETVEGLHFNEPDTSLTYGPQASYHQGNTLPWELANVQGQVMEGELLHGMPGPSGLQMTGEASHLTGKSVTSKSIPAARSLTSSFQNFVDIGKLDISMRKCFSPQLMKKILTTRFVPHTDWRPPLRQFGKYRRRIPEKFFNVTHYPTLRYSIVKDGLYCATCVVFRASEGLLVGKPLQDWSNAIRDVMIHLQSKEHMYSVQLANSFLSEGETTGRREQETNS